MTLWNDVRRLGSIVGLSFGLWSHYDSAAERAPWVGAKYGLLRPNKEPNE